MSLDRTADTAADTAATTDVTDTAAHPAGLMRLLPSVAFGTRAAALTRVALPIGMMAAGVAAAWPSSGIEPTLLMNTTCCPGGGAA